MSVPAWVKVAAAVFIAWSAWSWWHDRPVTPPAGVLAPDDPVQQSLDAGAAPIAHGRWMLEPRAAYSVTARVLSRETYAFDAFASAAPVDLALGWGLMSDNDTLRPIAISQGARFYTLHWDDDPPAPPQELLRHSANTHTIPANPTVEHELRALRAGQVVHLEGLLVDGRRDDGWSFSSSLTRDDTGAGACEVLYVERVEVVPVARP